MSATLDELRQVLGQIRSFADQGRDAFDADERQRWSIERLWIFAGNLAERHLREVHTPAGDVLWSDLIGIRNVYAHYTPSAINYDRVWHDTVNDIDPLISAVPLSS